MSIRRSIKLSSTILRRHFVSNSCVSTFLPKNGNINTKSDSLLLNKRVVTVNYKFFSSSASEEEFQKHVSLSKTLKEDPGNEVKLQMYALFKQASIGANNTPKPGAMDIVGKFKWSAWTNLGSMSQEDARKEYIALVQKLIKEIGTQ